MAKGLLLGAGFSFDLGMPLASEFSDTLFGFLNSFKIENLINNMRGHRPYSNDRTLCDVTLNRLLEIYNGFLNSENKNYEELFRIVESLQVNSREAQETVSYFLSKIRNIINELFLIYQKNTYFYYILNRDKYKWLIDQFEKEELWVFTLNHDVLIEMLCIDYKIPLNEGYSRTMQIPMSNINMEECIDFGKIDATEKDVDKLNYLKNTKGINILKIHGGLNEFFQGDEKTGRHRMIFDYHKFESSLNYLNALESFIHAPHYYINDRPPNIESEICVSDFDGVLQFMHLRF